MEFPIIRFFILFVLLFISAFFSGSETALFSFGKTGLAELENEKSTLAGKLKYLLSSPSRLLVTILLGNECVNVSISSIIASIFSDYYGKEDWKTAIMASVFVATPLILIFAEITPKAISIKAPKQFSLLSIRPLYYLSFLTNPLKKVLDIFKLLKDTEAELLTEEDFLGMVEASTNDNHIEEYEKKLIYNIFEFNDITVEKIMTPKNDVFFIKEDYDFDKIIKGIRETEYSRVPVLDEESDYVVGILYAKKLLPFLESYINKDLDNFNLNDIIVPVTFVPRKTKLYTLFKMLKRLKQHLCVIVDEHGDMLGIVTMEDILEEIFGEIRDERDDKQ